MLDVSIRISLLTMLGRLRDELGVGFLFITHDLAIAKYFGWHGKTARDVPGPDRRVRPDPEDHQHAAPIPYTKALIDAIPEPDPDLTQAKGAGSLRSLEIPSLLAPATGMHVPSALPAVRGRPVRRHGAASWSIRSGQSAACHVVAREARRAPAGRTGVLMWHPDRPGRARLGGVPGAGQRGSAAPLTPGTPEFVVTLFTCVVGFCYWAGSSSPWSSRRRRRRKTRGRLAVTSNSVVPHPHGRVRQIRKDEG